VLYERRQGRVKLLLCRGLQVFYGNVQVLFDVDFEVDAGEIIALLGTNGAGKSTLLKAISGVVEADKGAVIFDGRDITHAPPREIAMLGVAQVPGGQGVFPSLSVRENLRVAGWLDRRQRLDLASRTEEVLTQFPQLVGRLDDPAADLSGGQQQMLALGMAFLGRPRLLLIDELSLGLAPVVVEQLLPMVRAIRAQGTTIILVEQSVNLALMLAETAYYMEKGEIRFHGRTADLLARPEVLRAVFLNGTRAGNGNATATGSLPPVSASATAPVVAATLALAPSLEAEELTVRFGGIQAVDHVSLAVAPGEIVGIIGPNGAGKTTLFDLICGFTRASSGRVLLGGRDVSHEGPDRRARAGLGRSFQDARLFPSLTVEEAIAVALDRWVEVKDPINPALHLPAAFDSEQHVRDRVDELIALFNLEAFRSKFIRELSTGSRRMVDLACIVAHRPSVVLLDEPSSGIAQRETEALGPVLVRLRDELGSSLLVVEHDMSLVTAVADRLVALDLGAVIADGTPADVLHHPAVVSSYLGEDALAMARSGPSVLQRE
jgi:branched-chain amino acid transport system ATP-binding protein